MKIIISEDKVILRNLEEDEGKEGGGVVWVCGAGVVEGKGGLWTTLMQNFLLFYFFFL